jgi:hypothetical protein
MLEDRWYVLLHVNEYYIPNTTACLLRLDFRHDCLIVGCDGTKRAFRVATYMATGEYGLTDVSFTSMAMALILRGSKLFLADMICFDPAAVAVRPKRDLRFDFDVIAASVHLRDYLQSRPPDSIMLCRSNFVYAGDRAMLTAYPRDSHLYGIEAFQKLVVHLQNRAEAQDRIDMRDSRALWESKNIMHSNVEYWRKSLFPRDARQVDRYSQITAWARKLHWLCYLYNIEGRNNPRDLCVHLRKWRYIHSTERDILGHVLSRMVKA